MLSSRHGNFNGMGFAGLMLLSAVMTIPMYVIMREMSDTLKEIANKIAP
ncbi:MAG: hypothetical protein WAQ41_01240 [bacterium]|jgi:hypothetical protein|nr:hypothetical protein [Bacillota bacterium]